MNNFKVMSLVLMVICIILVLVCYKYKTRDELLVGSAMSDNIYLKNVTYFTNGDVYYITSAGAKYLGENKDIYKYKIGYYVGDDVVSEYEIDLEKKSTIKDIINTTSDVSVTEYRNNLQVFKKIKNIKNLEFRFIGASKKDKKMDVIITAPVKFYKISK